jgi:DNA-binding transcriptional LysR family regulator
LAVSLYKIAAGLGVAFLPQMIAEQRKHASVSRILLVEPDTDWHIAMVWRRGAYLSQAAARPCGVLVLAERKVVFSLQPVAILASQLVEGSLI